MITAAQIGAYGAALCTLMLNGHYASTQGTELPQQLAMIAIAITIDFCKIGFLPEASRLRRAGYWLAPALLVALWPLAFTFSTYSAYSSIISTKSTAAAPLAGSADERSRAQRTYDEGTNALDTAKLNPLWNATAACQAPKGTQQRTFCENLDRTRNQRTAAETILTRIQPRSSNPEAEGLAQITGQPLPWIIIMVALFPAVLLELAASLGVYAVQQPITAEASPKAVQAPRQFWPRWPRRTPKTLPVAIPEASDVPAKVSATVTGANTPPPPPRIWKLNPS
jgi:hypothetical protein